MAAVAKRAIKSLLATRLGWAASSAVRPRGATVLMYHRINRGAPDFPGMAVDQFRAQMQWLAKRCTPVAATDLAWALRHARPSRPPVVVTFDDGYRDYHDVAWPILRELSIPATVFLSTAFMDGGGVIWTDEVEWAIVRSAVAEAPRPWPGGEGRATIATAGQKRAFVAEAKRALKSLPDADRRAAVAALVEALRAPPVAECGRQMLSWGEVRAAREGTTYGGHTHTHPILSQLPPGEAEREIRGCHARIAAETREEPTLFAYPNGRTCDFNDTTRALLQRHGFRMAFTTEPGLVTERDDPLALRRQYTGARTLGDFAALVGGA